jgi:hypothetical protein
VLDYITATGGTITTSGNDKIHTFTGPGTFTVSSVSSTAANNVVSYVVVGGAGGGGGAGPSDACGGAGGGGAGGYREVKSPVTSYTASPLDGYPAHQIDYSYSYSFSNNSWCWWGWWSSRSSWF